MSLAIVLVSGGLDSCVAAAIASRGRTLAFLHLNYGQRTEARELRAFAAIADHYQVEKRLVVDLSYMRQIGGSSLIEAGAPAAEASALPATYVPFRNANLLGIAVAWAEVAGGREVFIGAHQPDSPYPDCRGAFFAAYRRVVETGTADSTHIQIQTPFIEMDKSAIIRRGLELGAPLHLTWSCYYSGERACGRCHSCVLRLKGFGGAGIADPISYA